MEFKTINEENKVNNTESIINTSNKQNETPLEQSRLINSNKSTEKILHLKPGYIVWKKVCTLFGISVLVFIISLVISLVVSPFLFILVGISALGILFCICFTCCCGNGFITINPKEAIVYQYYGRYLGTVKDNGYYFGYPFSNTHRISLKSNQFNGNKIKVNERDGNPVELGIIVIWKIGDTAKAIFDVENYNSFIDAQAEAAIRYIGCKYPYEPVVPGEISLRSGHEIINKELRKELERRIAVSGIIIEDARVTEISYGAEVANMMLQRQASNATVFAKDAIVKGATNAVMKSLEEFDRNGIQLSDNEKANYIIEMMNTLCMGQGIHKIIKE